MVAETPQDQAGVSAGELLQAPDLRQGKDRLTRVNPAVDCSHPYELPSPPDSLSVVEFPSSAADLARVQRHLMTEKPPPFELPKGTSRIAGAFVCFGRGGAGPGAAGDVGWAGSAVLETGRCIEAAAVRGTAGGAYQPGLLALREGPLLVAAVMNLDQPFEVLLVNATGRDHPRRAGLALHLGALLDVPTVGVTHRPLLARGVWPAEPHRGARAPLTIGDDVVGFWVRTRTACRPLAIHAGWRTDPDTACRLVVEEARRARTPEPLREARHLARTARAADARSS